jgi:hypothetical protein
MRTIGICVPAFIIVEKKIKDDDIMELSSTLSLKCPVSWILVLLLSSCINVIWLGLDY